MKHDHTLSAKGVACETNLVLGFMLSEQLFSDLPTFPVCDHLQFAQTNGAVTVSNQKGRPGNEAN